MTRVAPVLLASLLLHLAVLYGVSRLTGKEAGRVKAVSGAVVAYLELGMPGGPGRATAALPRNMEQEPAAALPGAGSIPAGVPSQPLAMPISAQQPAAPLAAPAAGAAASAARAVKEGSRDVTAARPAGVGKEGSAPETAVARQGGASHGGAAAAISAAPTAPGKGGNTVVARQLRDYQAQVRSLIEAHKEYPLAARKSGREGSCQRRFQLGRDGTLQRVETVSSCGHPFLDAAATRAIGAVGKFPPLPDEFAAEEPFEVTITFTLAGK